MTWSLIQGDCVEAMRGMDEASVDAIVTDPPYGLHFMGKTWDSFGGPSGRRGGAMHAGKYDLSLDGNRGYQESMRVFGAEALRVLKPGGHLLSFGGTRTYHRLTCGLEDAGFAIRDCLAWLYGSGFPKSLDVSKAIDKAVGAEREVVGVGQIRTASSFQSDDGPDHGYKGNPEGPRIRTAPATPDAERWQGWGTALKPAFEPIVLARKPLSGTVAANVLRHGTGALNIDGTRIEAPAGDRESYGLDGDEPAGIGYHGLEGRTAYERPVAGRWPANVVLDEEAAAMLDEQSGESRSRVGKPRSGPNGDGWRMTVSRFFYTAKTSRTEREVGRFYRESGHYCKIRAWDDHERASSPDQGAELPRATGEGTEADASGSSTTGSGSSTTGRSPRATKSTTGTATRKTTGSRTSSSSHRLSTSASTPPTTGERETIGNDAAPSVGDGSPPPPSTSTSAARAGSSTGAVDRATSPESLVTSAAEGRCPNCGEVVRSRVSNSHPT